MFQQDQSIFWYLCLHYFQLELGMLDLTQDTDFATGSFLSFGSYNQTRRSDRLLLVDVGNSLQIVFGWLEFLLMYTG